MTAKKEKHKRKINILSNYVELNLLQQFELTSNFILAECLFG